MSAATLIAPRYPITASAPSLAAVVKERAAAIGSTRRRWSGIRSGRGSVSECDRRQVPDPAVMRTTRHKTVAMLDVYTRPRALFEGSAAVFFDEVSPTKGDCSGVSGRLPTSRPALPEQKGITEQRSQLGNLAWSRLPAVLFGQPGVIAAGLGALRLPGETARVVDPIFPVVPVVKCDGRCIRVDTHGHDGGFVALARQV